MMFRDPVAASQLRPFGVLFFGLVPRGTNPLFEFTNCALRTGVLKAVRGFRKMRIFMAPARAKAGAGTPISLIARRRSS